MIRTRPHVYCTPPIEKYKLVKKIIDSGIIRNIRPSTSIEHISEDDDPILIRIIEIGLIFSVAILNTNTNFLIPIKSAIKKVDGVINSESKYYQRISTKKKVHLQALLSMRNLLNRFCKKSGMRLKTSVHLPPFPEISEEIDNYFRDLNDIETKLTHRIKRIPFQSKCDEIDAFVGDAVPNIEHAALAQFSCTTRKILNVVNKIEYQNRFCGALTWKRLQLSLDDTTVIFLYIFMPLLLLFIWPPSFNRKDPLIKSRAKQHKNYVTKDTDLN